MNGTTELNSRLARIREEIEDARARAGLPSGGVDILAVTKTRPTAAIEDAVRAGVMDIGENRVPELQEKVATIGRDTVRWHLIGHLQRNKVRQALPLFDLLHSLDSVRLAQKLSAEAVSIGQDVHALVQVNTSGEESKFGLPSAEALDAVAEISALPGVVVDGLMTMAPLTGDETVIRRAFAGARALYVEADRTIPEFNAVHLSMGMSNDYRIAVEEGSTLVRLGTVLFGGRDA